MKTLSQFRSIVYKNLGKSDSDTVTLVDDALNTAARLAAVLFDPPELRDYTIVTIANGTSSANLANEISNFMEVVHIHNTTEDTPVRFVPLELWHTIVPDSPSLTKYFYVYGSNLGVRAPANGNVSLTVFTRKYPANISDANANFGFDYHDGFIIAVATAIVWAAYEENESASLQKVVADILGAAATLSDSRRKIIHGVLADLDIRAMKGNQT